MFEGVRGLRGVLQGKLEEGVPPFFGADHWGLHYTGLPLIDMQLLWSLMHHKNKVKTFCNSRDYKLVHLKYRSKGVFILIFALD